LKRDFTSEFMRSFIYILLILPIFLWRCSENKSPKVADAQDQNGKQYFEPVKAPERAGYAKVKLSNLIPAPPEEVWPTLKQFGGYEVWNSRVREIRIEGEGIGSRLTSILEDGSKIVDEVITINEGQKILQYKLVEGDLPMRHYISTMKIEKTENGNSRVYWSAEFLPESDTAKRAVVADLMRAYRAGLIGLAGLHQGQ